MYFQAKQYKERARIKFKNYFAGLSLKSSHKGSNFIDFKCLPKSNNKQSPIIIKDKNIIIGIPNIFQHKYEISLSLNFPYKIYLYFSNSLKAILFHVKN